MVKLLNNKKMENDYGQAVMFVIAMINVERLGAQNIRQPFGVEVNPFCYCRIQTYSICQNL